MYMHIHSETECSDDYSLANFGCYETGRKKVWSLQPEGNFVVNNAITPNCCN